MRSSNGVAVAARLRTLVLVWAIAAALALSATVLAATASAAKPPHEGYLAIGDSLAFGYSQQLFNENEKTGENPAAFTNGYVDDYLKTLPAGVALTNDGCPGETTDSMIGNGPLSAQMAAALGTTGEAPCAYKYVAKHPLHNEYVGTSSQLENALEVTKVIGKGENPITTITLNIGANDQLHQLRQCEAEVKTEFEKEGKSKYGATPEEAQKNCILVHIPVLFEHILRNIAGSLYTIRNGSQFCVPAATSCPGKGEKGQDFAGKIVVQGGYNPFGAVVTPGMELLPGSNILVELLNFREANVVSQFGACYANPQPVFNPAVINEPGREPGQLQALTNMANTTVFEGKKNGPDIHATPAGYQELSNVMKADCG
jgi:lysophospholipase L1-like esterase